MGGVKGRASYADTKNIQNPQTSAGARLCSLYSVRCLWCNVSQCLTLNILSGIKESAEPSGFQTDELHVKGEGGVGWDDPWVSFVAIGVVR